MGIKGCQPCKVLWVANGLTLKSLKDLGVGNRIDIDGNALAYKLGAGKAIKEVIHLMALFLRDLAHSGGFVVTVVIDGDECPDCKQVSWFCKIKVLHFSNPRKFLFHSRARGGLEELGLRVKGAFFIGT